MVFRFERRWWVLPLFILVWAGCAGAPGETAGVRDIGGARLFVKILGAGDPVVVVHGGPALDHNYLLPGFAELARTHQVILYDQRGSGATGGPLDAENVTLANFVADIEGIRLELGIETINLLGHSFGAYIAAAYAVEHPDRLRSLILSNPTEPGDRYDALVNSRSAAARTAEDSVATASLLASDGMANHDPETLATLFRISFRPTFHNRALAEQLNISFTPAGADAVFEIGRLLFPSGRRPDLWDQLGAVSAPTLILGGTSDIIPPELLEALTRAFPNGRLNVIGEAGHFPHIENPRAYFEVIREFLR